MTNDHPHNHIDVVVAPRSCPYKAAKSRSCYQIFEKYPPYTYLWFRVVLCNGYAHGQAKGDSERQALTISADAAGIQ